MGSRLESVDTGSAYLDFCLQLTICSILAFGVQATAKVDRLVLDAACLFLVGERLNIKVSIWEACKALTLGHASAEEAPVSAFEPRLHNCEEALQVAANLALYNLVHREGDYMEVIHC